MASNLHIGARVMFRSGPYGDARDATLFGVLTAGPHYPYEGQEWESWTVQCTTGVDMTSSIARVGVTLPARKFTIQSPVTDT